MHTFYTFYIHLVLRVTIHLVQNKSVTTVYIMPTQVLTTNRSFKLVCKTLTELFELLLQLLLLGWV